MKFVRYIANCVCIFLLLVAYRVDGQDLSSRVQSLYEAAKSDEHSGHLDLAILKYQEMLRLSPDLATAYNNLGRLYYQQMQLENAVAALKRASVLEPQLAAPHALLGFSYYQEGAFADARRELLRAQQLNPADLNVKLFLARSLVQLGDPKGAAELLEKILQKDPHNVEALYTSGSVYSALAESAFGQIQTTEPDSYLLELLLGKAAEAKQVYTDAAEHYKRAIAKEPDMAELYYRYGHALWELGDLNGALDAYRHALAVNSFDSESSWEAARILVDNKPEEAYSMADQSLKVRPNNPDALIIRGRALLALGKPKEAMDDLQKASSLDPEDETVHFQLARAYRKLGMAEQAQKEQSTFEQLQKSAGEMMQKSASEHLKPENSQTHEDQPVSPN